jgi:hypothetical protein
LKDVSRLAGGGSSRTFARLIQTGLVKGIPDV